MRPGVGLTNWLRMKSSIETQNRHENIPTTLRNHSRTTDGWGRGLYRVGDRRGRR